MPVFCGAAHEAGHAVVAHVLDFHVREVCATSERSCCSLLLSREIKDPFVQEMLQIDLGAVAPGKRTTKISGIHWAIREALTPTRIIDLIAQSIAGREAELRFHPNVVGGDEEDRASEEELLEMLPERDRAAARVEAHNLATRLVEENEDFILYIASRLVHEGALERARFLQVVDSFEKRRGCEEG